MTCEGGRGKLLKTAYSITTSFMVSRTLCEFIYLALPTRAGSPQQHMPITVGPFLPNPPCQLSLWEETGVPGENPRLSAER
jgi:hypothetical protein